MVICLCWLALHTVKAFFHFAFNPVVVLSRDETVICRGSTTWWNCNILFYHVVVVSSRDETVIIVSSWYVVVSSRDKTVIIVSSRDKTTTRGFIMSWFYHATTSPSSSDENQAIKRILWKTYQMSQNNLKVQSQLFENI